MCPKISPLWPQMSRSLGVSPDSPPTFTASLLTEPGLSPPAYTLSAWKGRTGCLPRPPHPSTTQCKAERNSLLAWIPEQAWPLEAHVSSPSELAYPWPFGELDQRERSQASKATVSTLGCWPGRGESLYLFKMFLEGRRLQGLYWECSKSLACALLALLPVSCQMQK